MSLENFLIVGAIIFSIGLYGTLSKRNAITVLMSLELMFNGVNITAVAMSRYVVPGSLVNVVSPSEEALALLLPGQVFAIFIITVAAAEVGLALAIILRIYRNRSTVNVDEIDIMKW